eukprot:TRINITY_DN1902_c0_g1_i2.p1 TRINITY_DN1902_c0_g1~~TRINITY_DN1902_c0_g1_i2.p1  ORF type:complete len:489 (+),score=42.80 TRINITY_DN1902_c0_g1_i2:213-1679(+)
MKIDKFDICCLLLSLFHLLVCPFNKVEESFNLQATHDILYYGKDLKQYDHFSFPGVVPRSFVGPLCLSLLSSPFHLLLQFFFHLFPPSFSFSQKLFTQIIVRSSLGFLVVFALCRFRRSIEIIYGREIAKYFIMISSLFQFHLMFYSTRTLPNIFALILVLHGFSDWFEGNHKRMIASFVFCIVVFRSEVVGILGPLTLLKWITKEMGVMKTLKWGIFFGIISLGATISIDSIFWDRWLWPEGEVLWYNTYKNKSHEWGTSPFYWYFTSALPKSLLGALPLGFFGIWKEPRKSWKILLPILVFLILYSFLPHKELRFIFYVIPIFNLMAAVGLHNLNINRHKGRLNKTLFSAGTIALLLSFIYSIMLLIVSSWNYPGGFALQKLHSLESNSYGNRSIHVHVDVAAAMSGVSKFGEMRTGNQWKYSKEEDLGVKELVQFDYLLSESQNIDNFENIHSELGFEKISHPSLWISKRSFFTTIEKIFILKRK